MLCILCLIFYIGFFVTFYLLDSIKFSFVIVEYFFIIILVAVVGYTPYIFLYFFLIISILNTFIFFIFKTQDTILLNIVLLFKMLFLLFLLENHLILFIIIILEMINLLNVFLIVFNKIFYKIYIT